jgi:hypothetical protein
MTTQTNTGLTVPPQSARVNSARTSWVARSRWVRDTLRRFLTSSSTRWRTRDLLTVVGGYVVVVGLSAVLLAVWATAVAFLAGVMAIGSLEF